MLLVSIQALLSAPNPDDPLSDNIAKHWKANEAEAVETGKVAFVLRPCITVASHVYTDVTNSFYFLPPLFICSDNVAKEWTHLYANGA